MKTRVSSKGQIVLPAEVRQQDGIESGQEFEIERLDRGANDKTAIKGIKSGNSFYSTQFLIECQLKTVQGLKARAGIADEVP